MSMNDNISRKESLLNLSVGVVGLTPKLKKYLFVEDQV